MWLFNDVAQEVVFQTCSICFLFLCRCNFKKGVLISVDDKIFDNLPHLILGGFIVNVGVMPSDKDLLDLMDERIALLSPSLTPESIRNMPTVKANKEAYRILGKDPNRYRPSSESLQRRIANGKGLYHINNVVDILNLISVETGFSICGYDFDTIRGAIQLGIGEMGEPYEAIGRGELNIASLPVFRDQNGAFGTPTSDSVRTQVTDDTKRFMMVIIGFNDVTPIKVALDESLRLLEQFAEGALEKQFLIERI